MITVEYSSPIEYVRRGLESAFVVYGACCVRLPERRFQEVYPLGEMIPFRRYCYRFDWMWLVNATGGAGGVHGLAPLWSWLGVEL